MDDLISRQAAIDAMKNMYRAAEKWGFEASDDVIKARAESCMASLVEMKLRIENLPSAQERKKGKWIEDAATYYKAVNEKGGGVNEDTPYFTESNIGCSECLAMFSVIDNETERFDYCPNCGADMRGEKNDGVGSCG